MQERRKGYEEVVAHMATTNEKLDNICSEIKGLKEAKITQNGRIGKLENWKSYILGGFGCIGGLITLAGVVILWIKK